MFEIIPFDRHMNRASLSPFRFFDDFFSDVPAAAVFRTDMQDTGDAYILEAELPGFSKEEISLDVQDDCLTISAQHREEKEEKDDKKPSYIKRERYYGSCSRSFDVSGINVDGIEAGYENGVLTLRMPKKEETVPAARHLEIN